MLSKEKNLYQEQERKSSSFLYYLYTLTIFAIFILLIPCVVLLYLVVAACRIVWLRFLEQRFPELEFVRTTSVRTCVDTLRNQGIITLLLQVKGACDLNQFKAQLKKDILNKTKDGQLVFPHLKMALTSRYGRYAWLPDSRQQFDIENHVVSANPLFRGRSVTGSNIQEYVSDIVSKYLAAELPPWQITVIPCAAEFYVLIRLHHLYLSEDQLGLGDLLMLRPNESSDWCELGRTTAVSGPDTDSTQHLLTGTFRPPQALPQLYEHVCESFANSWNEIVSLYDPQENVEITKKQPTLRTFFILFAIILVSVAKEMVRSNKSDIFKVFMVESRKRSFTMRFFWRSLKRSVQPDVIIGGVVLWTWWFVVKVILHVPMTVLYAIRDTPLYIYWIITLLRVVQELLYLCRIVYTGPRVLLEEILFPESASNKHSLQTTSLCGRKVVSWSEPVPLQLIKAIRSNAPTNAASCEVILSAMAGALSDYFPRTGAPQPDSVVTIARFMPQEGLLRQSSSLAHSGGGLLCLPVPIRVAAAQPTPTDRLAAMHKALSQARSRQAALYLASVYRLDYGLLPKVLPTVVARVLLNMLSRRYSVTLTQVDNSSAADCDQLTRRRLLWGQQVESIMYWRPPQANISVSLTLMSYGDSVRLGVMTDALLANQHVEIANDFNHHIYRLAAAVGVSS
ncbi:uncharacterized protein LOC111054198 isoform X2 [Nilaparvata lugens]|nr:uncharacterized protein LOC111054198 isoform X2 [Nilaparvata lugens]